MDIILITSAPKSGASDVARRVSDAGAFGGIVRPPEKSGSFENEQIKARCVTPYVNRFIFSHRAKDGRRIADPNPALIPFKNRVAIYQPPHFRELVLEIFRREGWDGQQPLYFSMPLMALMSPVWHDAFPAAKWIIVRRDPAADVASPVMYIRALDALVSNPEVATKEVSYESLMADNLSAAEMMR